MGEKYKLVGVLNIYGVIPEFVYPVFENDKEYYIQNKYSKNNIDSFELIANSDYINDILPLDKYNLFMPIQKRNYMVGDEVLIAFQQSEDELFLGTLEEFKKYVKELDIEDEYMKVEIPYYIGELEKNYKED